MYKLSRWSIPQNFDGHYTEDLVLFVNGSTLYFPTLNCSKPKNLSNIASYIKTVEVAAGVDSSIERLTWTQHMAERIDIKNLGTDEFRVKFGDIEGEANESQGYIVESGQTRSVNYKVADYMTFYTSSNTSSLIQVTLFWHR